MVDGGSNPEINVVPEFRKFDPRRIAENVQQFVELVRERDLKGVLKNRLAGQVMQEKADEMRSRTNAMMLARAETPLGNKIYEELGRHELTQGVTPEWVVEKYNLGIKELSKLMEIVTRIPQPVLETLFHGAHFTELLLNKQVMWRDSWQPRVDRVKDLAARASTNFK